MNPVPVITIFVRHAAECPHAGDEFHKRCDCWKHLRWFHNGRRYRRKTKSRTWAGAERVRREVEAGFDPRLAEVLASAAGAPHPALIRQAAEMFVQRKAGEGWSRSAVGKYRRELARFANFCDQRLHHTMESVSAQDLLDYRETWKLTNPLSGDFVRKRLKSFFYFCHKMGYMKTNLLEGHNRQCLLAPFKVERAPTLPLTPQEYQSLLDTIPRLSGAQATERSQRKQIRLRAFVQCMRYTGLAIQDTVTLERARIVHDLERNITRVAVRRIKTDQPVQVPIPQDVALELMAVPNDDPKYVFWTPRGGKVVSAVTYWTNDMKRLFAAAKIAQPANSRAVSHRLRDTFAERLLVAGVPLEEVSKLLGHSSLQTTEKHYAPWVRRRQERLDAVVTATWEKETLRTAEL